MKKVLIFIAVLPIVVSAQISEGIDTLSITNITVAPSIDLNTGNITSNSRPGYPLCFYPCSTKITSGDLIGFFNYYTTCSCPCENAVGLGASHPFYISKQNFASIDLSGLLNLNDTALFSKVDTIKNGNNIIWCDDTGTLPNVEISIGESEQVIVLETSQQKYAMVRVNPYITKVVSVCMVRPDTFTIMAGVILNWYIQNDGSLDFSGIKQQSVRYFSGSALNVASKIRRYRVGLASSLVNRQNIEVYTLEGKRIEARTLKRVNTLVIYR